MQHSGKCMNKPLVTIGIPFFNNELTLVDTVKSVFAQTYSHWELFLINDGSTDGSVESVRSINDPRVRLIDDGINRGLVYRLNQITALANGAFIARMDGDDLMMPERIEKQLALITSDHTIDVVDTAAYTVDETGVPVGKRGAGPIKKTGKEAITQMMLLHGSILGRKHWFERNPYDPVYIRAEDYELFCRTHPHSNFQRVHEYLYIIREGKINIANYLKSKATLRRILQVYGKNRLSPSVYFREVLDTYLKSAVYKSAGFFKLQGKLSARRNQPLDAGEKEVLAGLISEIRSITLT